MTTPTAELAQDRIDDFQQKHGAAALRLARYAALPVVLNPDLLHLLRINFLLDVANPPDHTDEADLLLSPLCREIEDGLYEMLPEVRTILLRDLAAQPDGVERIRDVATLLWEYTRRYAPWSERPNLERAQQLTALNFLDPEQASAWLEQAASQVGADAPLEREWFVAMRGELARGKAIHYTQEQTTSSLFNRQFDPQKFIDREFEQELFEELLRFADESRILAIRDASGTGKSYLLSQFQYRCRTVKPRIPVSLVALDQLPNSDPLFLIREIIEQLKLLGVTFPGFDLSESARLEADFPTIHAMASQRKTELKTNLPAPDQSPKKTYHVRLRKLLTTHFSEEELKILCFDLEIDYDSLSGNDKAGKARELVIHCEHQGRLFELVAIGKRLRPDIDWDAGPELKRTTFGELLKFYRQRAILTQFQLAELISSDRTRLGEWESGKRTPKNYAVVEDLADILLLSQAEAEEFITAYIVARKQSGRSIQQLTEYPYRARLSQIVTAHFSEDELKTFCFDLEVDYDSLLGENRMAKVRELITYCERQGRLFELVVTGKRLRPDILWDDTSRPGSEQPSALTPEQQSIAQEVSQRAFFDDLRAACAANPVVIMLDAYEKCATGLKTWIIDHLLEQVCFDLEQRPDNLALVIAGREMPEFELHWSLDDCAALVRSVNGLSRWARAHVEECLKVHGMHYDEKDIDNFYRLIEIGLPPLQIVQAVQMATEARRK